MMVYRVMLEGGWHYLPTLSAVRQRYGPHACVERLNVSKVRGFKRIILGALNGDDNQWAASGPIKVPPSDLIAPADERGAA